MAKSDVALTLALLGVSFPASAQQRGAATLAYQLTHIDTGEPFPSPAGDKIVFETKIAGFLRLSGRTRMC